MSENKEVKSEGAQISIKVKDAEGQEIIFKIRRTTPMQKLMKAYCTRQGLREDQVQFVFDGKRVNKDDTPDSLDLEDDDLLDVVTKMVGGRGV